MNVEIRRTTRYSDAQRREAAEWFVVIHDAKELPADTLQAWSRWLGACEGNREAFQAVERAYHVPIPQASVRVGETPDQDDYDGEISVAEWRRRATAKAGNSSRVTSASPRQGAPSRTLGRPRWTYPLATAAGVAAVFLLWSHFKTGGPIAAGTSSEFATQTGDQMELVLRDGSRVTLGARSELAIAFTPTTREVHLKAGEAFFSVRKNAQRPFVVRALDGVVTAVGTAFNVRATVDELTVAVADGAVRVANDDRPNALSGSAGTSGVQIMRGEQLSFTPRRAPVTAPATKITRINIDEAARWRAGWLVYRNEPLRYVIADVARYTNLRLEVAHSVSDDLRFTGAVFKDSVAEWVTALPEVFPVKLESDGTHMTITSRPEAPGTGG